MNRTTNGTGGGESPSVRLLLLVAGVAGLLGGVLLAGPRDGSRAERGPVSIPNASFSGYLESRVNGIPRVLAREGPERIAFDALPPDRPARLLWLQGRTAQPDGSGSLVLDGAGGVVRFDERLQARRVPLRAEGREILSVAPGAGGIWAADAGGELLRVGPGGEARTVASGPFTSLALAPDPAGQGIWAARSPQRFAYLLAEEGEPLLARFDPAGEWVGTLGVARLPEHVLLAELANAGHLVASWGRLFYAPFIRDELVALSPEGDTLWVMSRGLPQSIEEPRFELQDGRAVIEYHPVNLGLVLGPDRLLYLLSTPGFSTTESRLDVVDPESGRLLRSGRLPTATPTLAADGSGRVYLLDPFRLLTGLAPEEREPFPSFDLPGLDGRRIASTDLRGKVVLLNFWASWCAPCREEMPALDSLRRSIPDADFAFVAMNEDQQPEDARAFLDDFGFDFPVALGQGKLKERFRYVGLPFTVLLDREGRVVQRWTGYGGETQMDAIQAAAVAELARSTDGGNGGSHHH
jgi:thiol-disulfide isomerase/thioredoxin